MLLVLYSWSAFCYLCAVETLQLILYLSFSGKPHVLKPLRLPLGEFVLWKKTNFCFGVTLTWRVALQNIWWLLDAFGFRGKFIALKRKTDDPIFWWPSLVMLHKGICGFVEFWQFWMLSRDDHVAWKFLFPLLERQPPSTYKQDSWFTILSRRDFSTFSSKEVEKLKVFSHPRL